MERHGGGKRRRFSAEYKAEAVRLVGASGKRVVAIARELGLGETALRRWVQQAEIDAGGGSKRGVDDQRTGRTGAVAARESASADGARNPKKRVRDARVLPD